MSTLNGVYVVTVTPFKEDGSINFEMVKKHIEHLIASGVHGLLPIGATGEFSTLSIQERKDYAEFIMKEVNGRIPVVIGAVSQSVNDTLELIQHAATIGVAGAMVLPCPALHISQEEIYEYYKYLSDNITIPMMIYNNPGSAGVDIEPETMARVAKLKNVAALKESTGDIARLTRSVDELKDDMNVFCGQENLAFESFVMGAKGWVSVLANVAPQLAVELYDSVVNKGDLAKGRQITAQVMPFLRLTEESGQLWQVAKYALEKQGFGKAVLRRPRLPITAENKAATDKILAECNLR